MALTRLQRDVCQALAARRRTGGASYVAGGAALGEATGSSRLSRDVDVFHDAVAAVAGSSAADLRTLEDLQFDCRVVREYRGFVEAVVARGGEEVLIQWAADSAYRFFPLVEHDDFGLTLHPFDLATNKVLALVGRLEVRDWLDVLDAHRLIQPLGLMTWAACGKDPGFSPRTILAQAARSARYTQCEIDTLDFRGPTPDAGELSRAWHSALDDARDWVDRLPAEHVGRAVLDHKGDPFTGGPRDLADAVAAGHVRFHEGRVGGALPVVRDA